MVAVGDLADVNDVIDIADLVDVEDRSDTMSIAATVSQIDSDDELEHFEIPCKYITVKTRDESEPPSISAAANPDPRVLKAVLKYGHARYQQRYSTLRGMPNFPKTTCRWGEAPFLVVDLPPPRFLEFGPHALTAGSPEKYNTPLLQAIRSQLPANVKTLLKAGANPHGISLEKAAALATTSLRFAAHSTSRRTSVPWDRNHNAGREMLISMLSCEQIAVLTDAEIEDRFYDTCLPFWTEEPIPDSVGSNFLDGPRNVERGILYPHSLVEAARGASTKILDMLLEEVGSNCWVDTKADPDDKTTALCLSTPLHAAIESGNVEMMRHLLEKNFDPNVQQFRAFPTRCFTPAMATIILCEPWNEVAFHMLGQYSKDFLDGPNNTTPLYGVHFIHFAVARLDIRILQACERYGELDFSRITALGHTLLHVACMPEKSTHIQRYSKAIFESIHEVRSLSLSPQEKPVSCRWDSNPPSFVQNYLYNSKKVEPTYTPDLDNYFPQQTATVQYLLERGRLLPHDLYAQDIHGNTALHYLAGHKVVNMGLLSWLLALPDANNVWTGVQNRYGYTALMLFNEGLQTVQAGLAYNWRPWFTHRYSVMRGAIKAALWERITGDFEDEEEYRDMLSEGSKRVGDMQVL